MPLVVGVSFKKAGKVYYFDPAGLNLHEGDVIIAETARGIEFGEVMVSPKEVADTDIVSPLKRVLRVATEADLAREDANTAKEKQAASICQQRIQAHNLPMKLIDAEYCFDGSQVTFYFSSESRVDFRELVKDLASALKAKVQLHQVGVRDEARFFGGIGPCGRGLCCATFLNGFEPVSMKMAKEQCLFLNPLKFSGICGKLMCCLKFEYPMYRDAKARLPEMGSTIETPKGQGRVVELNMVRESVGVDIDGVLEHYTLGELNGETNESAAASSPGCCDACPREAAIRSASPQTSEGPTQARQQTSGETVAEQPEPGASPDGGRQGRRGRGQRGGNRRPRKSGGEKQPQKADGARPQPTPPTSPAAESPKPVQSSNAPAPKDGQPRPNRRPRRRGGRARNGGEGGGNPPGDGQKE